MAAACELALWFGNEATRDYAALAETPQQRERRELIEFIKRRGGTVTVRDVITYHWPLKNQTEKAEAQLNSLEKAGYGKWEEIRPEGRGRPTQVFRLFPTSASAQFPILPSMAANCADADSGAPRKTSVSADSDVVPI